LAELNAGGHYDLGTEYTWDSIPPGSPATLTFQLVSPRTVTRTPSTTTTPGSWQ
jgi:hypothetical protein